MFYTILHTPDNQKVILPNSTLSNATTVNYSANPIRRANIKVLISYDSDIQQVKEVLLNAAKSIPQVLDDPAPFVAFGEFNPHGMVFYVRVWAPLPDFWTCYFKLHENIKEGLDAAGIEIPYDQLDVHLRQEAKIRKPAAAGFLTPTWLSASQFPAQTASAEDDEHNQRRQHDNEKARHNDVPLRCSSLGGVQHAQTNLGHPHIRCGSGDVRPEVFIPHIDELNHQQRRHIGPGQRQEDVPQVLHGRGAIDAGRISQFLWHCEVKLPEENDSRSTGKIRNGEGSIGVQPVPVGHHPVQRDDAHWERHHLSHHTQGKQEPVPAELEVGKGEGREDGEHNLAECHHYCDDRAVSQEPAHVDPHPGFFEIVPKLVSWAEDGRESVGILMGVGGHDKGIVHRKSNRH